MTKYQHLLVTCGATRNFIDSMRCITANASGKTGVAIAKRFPAHTHLLGSPIALVHMQQSPPMIKSHQEFSSTRDLLEKMKEKLTRQGPTIVVHSAAVGDYELASPSKEKIPSQQKELLIRLQPTPKILDKVKDWSPSSFLISFKAASPETSLKELEKIAQKQRERSRSDIVFANILGQIGRDVLIVLPERSMYFKTREEAMKQLTTRIAEKLS